MSRQRSRSRGPPAGRVPPNSGYTVRFTGRVRSSRRLRGVHLEFDNSAVEEQTTATRCVSLVARGADDSDDTELSSSDQGSAPSDTPVRRRSLRWRRGSLRGTTPAVPASLEPEREPPGTPTPPAASPTFGGPPPPTPSGPPDFSRLAAAFLWRSAFRGSPQPPPTPSASGPADGTSDVREEALAGSAALLQMQQSNVAQATLLVDRIRAMRSSAEPKPTASGSSAELLPVPAAEGNSATADGSPQEMMSADFAGHDTQIMVPTISYTQALGLGVAQDDTVLCHAEVAQDDTVLCDRHVVHGESTSLPADETLSLGPSSTSDVWQEGLGMPPLSTTVATTTTTTTTTTSQLPQETMVNVIDADDFETQGPEGDNAI